MANYKKWILALSKKAKIEQVEQNTNEEDGWESDYDFENEDLKMVFVVRQDIGMGLGKTAAQVAHAAVGLYDQIKAGKSQYHKKALEFWSDYGAKKIVLNGKDHEQLQNLQKECKKNKIPSYLVADAGHTQLEPGTVTVLGIGPDSSEKINKITGKLRLLK